MATYEEIKTANAAIATTDIKGKEYAEVNQRVKAFRMVYPDGCISSEMVSLENGVCVMKATCWDGAGNVLSTGYAYEKEGSTFINKTSYIENCETSAVGRALGMAGFGIDTSICSAEELQNAVLNQGDSKKSKPTGKKTKAVSDTVKDAAPDMDSSIADTPEAVNKLTGMVETLAKMGATAFMDELRETYDIQEISDIKKKDYRTIVKIAQTKYDLLKGDGNE